MTWVKLDDNFADHPKVRNRSDQAFRLFVDLLVYCGRYNTDGRLTFADVESHRHAEYAVELVEAGLWDETATGFEVHDFLVLNPSREKVEAEREKARTRKERWRERRSEQRGERATEPPPRPDPTRPEGSRVGESVTTPNPTQPVDNRGEWDPKANLPHVQHVKAQLRAVQ